MMIKKEWLTYLNLKVLDIFIINCVKYNEEELLNIGLKQDKGLQDSLDNLLSKKILSPRDNFYELASNYDDYMYSEKKKEVKSPKIDIKEIVDKYRDLFPKGLNSNGFPYKGDKQGTTKKLHKFMKNNPEYTESIILKATEKYINEKRKDNFSYMKLAHYFIEKDGVSDLGAFCEQIVNGESFQNYENIINL